MRLIFIPTNTTWAFVLGDSIVPLEGFSRFFEIRCDAVAAAESLGLSVNGRGRVGVME